MKIHTHKKLFIVGALLFQGVAHGQIANGLLNYWKFENNALDSASSFPGQTGTSNSDGTVNGTVSYTASKAPGFGQAASFPGGAGNNITIEDPTAGKDDIDRTGGDLSISVWFQAAQWTTGWQAILAHGEGQDYRIARSGTTNPTKFAAVIGTTDIQTSTTYGVPPAPDGLWHHLVVTGVNLGEGRLYVDGVFQGTSTGLADPTVSIASNTTRLCIGCNPANGREFQGLIDEVAMWDRVLTPAEVTLIYDTGVAGNSLATILQSGDSDGDGLPDAWEDLYGLNKNDNGSVNPNNGASGDPDMDGVTNINEFNNRTFPNDNDSDDDTLLDGVETNNGPNSWVSAANTGTDPLRKDTDGDGLNDNLEDNGGNYVSPTQTGSNPTKFDTDNDGMPDGYEVTNALDPNVDDSLLDPDLDTLGNLVEFGLRTNPQDDDSDDDFSKDGAEVTLGTNPLDPDTDDDTLLDGYETNTGTFVSATNTGTNPLLADTDGDSTHDGAEIAAGRNPLVADGKTSGLGRRLVAYWNFDNNLDDIAHTLPGESIVADTGTFTGPVGDVGYAPTGLFGSSALLMNGGAGWVTVPASFDTLRGAEDAVSISAWFRVSAFTTNWQAIISHGEGNQYRLARRADENTVAWAGGSGDIPGANLGPIVNDNLWHHVVTTSDPVLGQTQLYVDGSLIATGAAPNIVDFVNGAIPNLYIGANPQGANREWSGEIDDLAIWGRPITPEEVAVIYNAGNGESIENLLGGGGPPLITDVTYNSSSNTVSLTWTSREGTPYGIYGSTNLADDFPLEINDEVLGEDGTTTSTFVHPSPGAPKFFFRVEPPRL